MKKRFSIAVLLTIILGLLPSTMAFSQTYTISPTGYTGKPSYQTLGGIWTGYTSGSDPVWIEMKAEQSGSSVKFTVRKSSGTFNNSVSFEIRRDITVSGSNITSKGTYVETGSISSGRSSGSCTITPASGTHEYRVILTSGNIVFYTRIVTITVSSTSSLDTPDYTQFSYSNVTSTGFRAKWAAVSGATKYNILVKKKSDSDYSNPVFEAYNKTTTYCDVTGLEPSTSYQFQVQAINSTEKSAWSKSIQTAITTSSEYTLDTPDYTQFSYSNVTSTGFRAKWAAVSGATKYNILVKKKSDSDYSNPVFEAYNKTTTYCDVTGLQPNTSYQFQVQAINSTEKSAWSKSIQTAITTSSEYTLDTPDYTQFSYSNVTSTGFRAKWAAVSGATKYNILVKKKSDSDYSNPVFEAYNKTTTYCDVTGLQPNTSYQFQVQAINSTEKSAWSKSIQTAITTSSQSTGTLNTPDYTKFSATNITTTGFTANWSAVSGATQYYVLVKKYTDSDYSNPVYDGGSQSTSCKITGLQSGTSYQFQVRAVNGTQMSNWSKSIQTPITTKTESSSLDTPDYTQFSYSDVTTTGFTAKWAAVSGATQYDILVKKSTDSDYSNPVYDGGSSTTSRKISNLEPNTSYQFQVRARNSVAKSTWSKSIQTPIKTANKETAPANLTIHTIKGFDGTKSLIVGKTYKYSVYVLNNSSSTWKGSFYLKEDGKDLNPWYGISLPFNVAQQIDYYYTPQSVGTKSLELYYQTGGTGKGELIPGENNISNPISVKVIADQSVNTSLKLAAAITAPTDIEMGKSSNIKALVKNTASTGWLGTIYITDNDLEIGSTENLAGGETKTIFANNWQPDKDGKHSIAVYYQSKNSSKKYKVDANDFSNPVIVIASNTDVVSEASKVIIRHLTKGVVPEEVTPGSNVYYHFRLKDEKGKQLKGTKLRFKLEGSDRVFETEASDQGGYAVLCLTTEGSNAIAGRGVTAKLSCTGAISENGNLIPISANTDDKQISLKVHKGNTFSEGSGTENVEKAELTMEAGGSVKADWKTVKFKAGAGAALTTKIGIKFNNAGEISEYSLDGGLKGSASASLGEKSKSPLYDYGIGETYGEGLLTTDAIKGGITANIRCGFATSDPLDLIVRFVMNYVDNYTEGTSRVQDMAVKAMRYWYSDKRKDDISCSWSYGGSVGLSGKMFSCWPGKSLARPLVMPIVKYTDFGISGEGSWTVEPDIVRATWNTTHDGDNLSSSSFEALTGTSSTLKLKGNFDAKLKYGQIWNDAKSWWSTNVMHQFHKGKLGETFPSASYSYDKTLTLKHEEMYDSKQLLREVSQSFATSSGWEVSADKIKFGDKFPGEFSFGISNKTTSKLSTKGGWATFLSRISVPDGSESYLTQLLQGVGISTGKSDDYRQQVFKVYPNLARNTLICSPAEIVDAWKQDFDEPLSRLAEITPNPQDYKLAEAVKLEEKVTSEMDMNLSIKVYDWKAAKFYIDGGVTLGIDNRPSTVSYYSLPDRRFFTVVQRPTTSIEQTADWMVDYTSEKINEAFEACKGGILKAWDWLKDTYNYVVDESTRIIDKAGDWIENNIFFPIAYHQLMKNRDGANARQAFNRHPKLAEKEQSDICRFSVGINKDEKNFDPGVVIEIPHYYPAGDLLGVTDQGDTIFVVSEVCDIVAIQGTDTLRTTQYGEFTIEGISGADDLTPFGFREDQPLDVYYSEEGSDIWQYLGPAGTTLKTNRLGTYMMGTSIKNDVIAPEILADFDEQNGIIHINVSENIGLKLNTLSILLNGEVKEYTMINESNYELELSYDDLQYLLNLSVTIYDLAGNIGSLTQAFQLDKPEKVNIEDQPDTDIDELENTIYPGYVTIAAGGDATLSVKMKNSVEAESFQFDVELPAGITVVTDEDGFPEAELSLERTSKKKTDTFNTAFLENGALRVIAGSTGGYSFSGNDGEVATIKLHVDNNVTPGYYPIVLRNISISDVNAISYDVAYVKSTIYVGEGLKGNVNGDDVVDTQDVVDLILYIAGKKNLDFNAADVNGDGVVNSADVIMVSNSILNK